LAYIHGREPLERKLHSWAPKVRDPHPVREPIMPMNFSADHDPGRRNPEEASLQAKLKADPTDAAAAHHLGVLQARRGAIGDAVRHLELAISLKPDFAEAMHNLGVAYVQMGRSTEAVRWHERAVATNPTITNWKRDLASTLRKLGRTEEALQVLNRAAESDPTCAELHHDIGLTLADLGRHQPARAAYEEALSLKEEFPEALNNLGVLCETLGDLEAAERYLRKAIAVRPTAADGHNNLGVVLAAALKFDESIAAYRRALALAPDSAAALNNLGNALRSNGELEEAQVVLREAIRLRPDYAEAYNNLAIVYVQLGKPDLAMECYNQALYFWPDYPEAHMNRSLDWLAIGEFEKGWTEYEWRWCGKAMRPKNLGKPRWDGSPPDGKRILVHYEQGIGDSFQFVRYFSKLKQLGATVYFEGQKPIGPVLERTPGLDAFIRSGVDSRPEFDLHVPLLSLPGIFNTTLDDVPTNVPYIFPKPELVEAWRARFADRPEAIRIAIGWQGNPEYRGDRQRSIPLKHFRWIADIPNVELISIQRGFGTEQLEECQKTFSITTLDDVDTKNGAFMDTAAIMKAVDLVITSDTAVAHLAGAMGVPVWVVLPTAADWRWMSDREDCPWYPTMRLFRQSSAGNWDEVFRRVATAVEQRAGARNKRPTTISDEQKKRADAAWQEGVTAVRERRFSEAVEHFSSAMREDGDSAKCHHDLGVALANLNRTDEACDHFRIALELNPSLTSAYGNLGLAHLNSGRMTEAVSMFKKGIRQGAHSPDLYNNLGVALLYCSKPAEAAGAFRQALQLRPQFSEAHCNLARALLIQGDYEQGWIEYEWRLQGRLSPRRKAATARWGGLPLGDRRLLVKAEQGFGDTLMFVRYLSLIRQGGGHIVLQCPRALHPLLKLLTEVDELVPENAVVETCDLEIPLQSLPGLLGTRVTSIPAEVPYLRADQNLVDAWRQRLERIPGLRVGIAWQGNPAAPGDRYRSIPLEHFEALARVPGVRLISLQKGFGCEQIPAASDRVSVVDFGAALDEPTGNFMDTAAIIKSLDLVITVDTAIAHLAGGLGVETWVILGAAADYRWLMDREDSPWYPTVRLFRQERLGDWKSVMNRVAAALRKRSASPVDAPSNASMAGRINAEALHKRGREQFEKGQIAVAIDCFERAILSNRESAESHHDLGVALASSRQFTRAIKHFEEAIRLKPKWLSASSNLVLAQIESGDLKQAAQTLEAALKLHPNAGILHHRLGVVAGHLGRREDAVRALEQARTLLQDSPPVHHDLGLAYAALGRRDEAIAAFEHAIEIDPEFAEAYNNLGVSYAAKRDHESAIRHHQKAVELKPDFAEAYNNLGVCLADVHRLDESAHALRRALYFKPDAVDAHNNLAIVLLLQGNLEQGWLEYEWRFKRSGQGNLFKVSAPRWDGSPLDGKSILMCAEQGLGDTLQFVRYAELLANLGARVVLECQAPLVPLLSRLKSVSEVIPSGATRPHHDFYCPLLSLPCTLGTSLTTIPNRVPYIVPLPERLERWRPRINALQGLRVGVAWQGSKGYPGDAARSIPLESFKPLAEIPGVTLVSLQKGPGAEQLNEFQKTHAIAVFEDIDVSPGAFEDSAAVASLLDLVICSDSAITHLAGAVGADVWLALCRPSDWRWMRNRDDSPWYPTMKLFRQDPTGRWEPVFDAIRAQLEERVRTTTAHSSSQRTPQGTA
jgi:Flp pilus assembly protein TadD/ADP-heptose:LPS heptosyltransferase